MCDCINTIDKLLAEHNAKLGVIFNLLTGKSWAKIAVEKLESRKRGSAPVMIPTYCPFCGESYEPQPAVAAQAEG